MRRLALPLVLLLFWSGQSIFAQEVSLRFDPSIPTKGTTVAFTTADAGSVPVASWGNLPLRSENTQALLYTLSVDTHSFGRDKYGRFSFDAYVRSAHASERDLVQKYVVYQDPTGQFLDTVSPVTFHIKGRAGEDAATIMLPLHSNDGSDNLSLAIPTAPLKVGLSGPSSSDLGLNNTLESLHVAVLESEISSTSCEDCWLSLSVKPSINSLAPKKGTSLIVNRRPNTFKAFGKSMFALNPSEAHDTLRITVTSVSEQGGLQAPQEFKLPVRFAPPALYLVLAVLLGGIIGGLLRSWLKDGTAQPHTPGRSRYVKDLATSLAIAVIVWVIALVLFSYTETRVSILGFSFDPSQVIPAGLISLLVAGGPPIVTKIKNAFGG